MNKEMRKQYAIAYRKRNIERMKKLQHNWYQKTRPLKTEEIVVKKQTKEEKLIALEEQLRLVEEKILELSLWEKSEFLVSRQNAILLKIEALKKSHNSGQYQPSIAIMR